VLPLDTLQGILYRILLVQGRQRRYLIAATAAAVANVILCILLIPAFGVLGAAGSAVGSMLVLVSVSAWSLRRWLAPELRWLDPIRLFLALGGMAAAVLLTPTVPLLFRIALGGIVYAILTLALRLLTLQDWRTTRQLMHIEAPTVPTPKVN
jgi:O-antigen/teichoic acid export membrane protein